MGKRFVIRTRQEWESLLVSATESDELNASASQWLADRLEGYVQSTADAPVTLAVPDRFAATLGHEAAAAGAQDGQRAGVSRERPVR